MSEQKLRQQVDGILHRAHEAWQKPQVRRRIKWTAVILILINIVAWPLSLYFIARPDTAEAAQVTIDSAVYTTAAGHNGSSPTTVFTSQSTGYTFYSDSTRYCAYSKTTNGGTSWGEAVNVYTTSATCVGISVWYDRWTPGDTTGNLIHIANIDTTNDDIFYRTLDTSTDTLSAAGVNITSGLTYTGTLGAGTNTPPAITKATDGALYAAISDATDNMALRCTTTCTTATNWSVSEPASWAVGNDSQRMVPMLSGGVMFMWWDISATSNDIKYAIWNGSWGAWQNRTTALDNTTYDASWGADIDPSTGDVYLAYANSAGTLGTDDDVMVMKYSYSGGTWSTLTNVVTNSACAGGTTCGITGVKITRDNTSGELFVMYTAQATAGTASTGNVYLKESTDDGSTWGPELGPLYSTNDDIYGARLNLQPGDRIYATWYAATPDDLFGRPIDPHTYSQSAYRWFANQDSTDVGSPLTNQDTAYTLTSDGQDFRLRMLIHESISDSFRNEQQFKLQYAVKSGTCDTAYSGESYADVTTSTPIAFYDNASVADGAALTANANDPAHGGDTRRNQTYDESNNFTHSQLDINVGEDGMWDFALVDYSAPASTSYCFRALKSDGTAIGTPTVVPEIATMAPDYVTISGTSDMASGTVAVAVNSTRQAETGTITGAGPYTWSVANVILEAGQTVTVWIDGATDANESTAVTNYSSGTTVSGMVLNQNVLTIGSNQNTSVSVTNLGQYDYDSGSDGGDEDVMHTANSSVLDVEGSSNSYTDEGISILASNTLTISGTETLDTHNVTNAGTLTSGGNSTYTVSGSWTNSGTFTASTSTANFTSGATGETLTGTMTGATGRFNNIVFNNTVGAWSFGANSAETTGNFTITASETSTSGVTAPSTTLTIAGNYQNTAGRFTHNSGTVTMTAGDTGNTLSGAMAGNSKFYNLVFNNAAGAWSFGANQTETANDFTITASETATSGVTAPSSLLLVRGSWANTAGRFTNNAGSVLFGANSGTKTFSGTMTGTSAFNSVTFNDYGGSATFRPTDNMTVNADFTLTDGILDLDTNDPTMQFGEDSGTGNFTLNGGSITNSNSANLILNDNPTEFDDNVGMTLGNVVIGQSPATTNLKSDMSATTLTISSGDVLNTRGWEVTVSGAFDCQGTCTLDTTDTGGANNEGNGTIITVGGNYTMSSSGTFTLDTDAGTPTKNVFNGAANYTLTTGGKTFWQWEFANTNANDDLVISGDLDINGTATITDGELKLDTNNPNVYIAGDFTNGSAGVITKGTGTWYFDPTGTKTYTDNASTKQDIGIVSVSGGASTPKVELRTSAKFSTLTIATSHEFDLTTSSYTLELGGTGSAATVLTNSGTFSSPATSTVKYTATNSGGNVNLATVAYNNLELAPGTSETYLQLANLTSSNAITGNVTIGANATWDNDSTNKYSTDVKGNWSNSGAYTHNSGGTVTFAATATGKTINSGGTGTGETFYNIVFNSSTGGWTIQTNNLTADNNFTITDTAASGFTVSSVTVEVKGTYSIADAETSNTAWTSATLYLNSGTAYTVGSKTQNSETYSTLQIGANTDIRMWNSSASTYTVDSSGSLYSMDHSATNGDLYIWGDYNVPNNATDYWNYVEDFDGTGSTNRQVDVRIDPSAKVTVGSGETLKSVGGSSNRTTVDRQGASNGYEIVCDGGTINIQYTDFDYLDGPTGLDIKASSTVTDIANNTFENLVGTGGTDANITVVTTVIGSGTKTLSGNSFTLGSGDKNVARTGSDDTGYWSFGTTNGEADDWNNTAAADEANPGMLRWNDSTTNTAPNNPTALVQKKTDDTVISTGGWINETSVKFTATASDTDNPDTLQLCVEKDLLGTSFANTEDSCGTGVAYSGSPVTVTLTIGSLTDASEYHWQARVKDAAGAYSSWVSYDTNLESERDFGIDNTAPSGGTIKDGTSADQDYNDGSLTSISANWTGTEPNSNVSGLLRYEYAIRRLYDGYYWSVCTDSGGTWQVGENWCNNTTSTSFTRNGMNLSTGVTYYVSVKTFDNASNNSTISSNGQQVLPTLSFSISSSSVTFDNLNNSNSWTDGSKTTTITTSTNASNGYSVTGFINQLLTSSAYPSRTIANFSGTWATPQNWVNYCKDDSNDCGYGYTSSDTLVQGSNRFSGGTLFCAFSTTGPGDIVADHTAAVNGSTGAVSNEQFTITHKVSVPSTQAATTYETILTLIVTANF